MKTILTLTILCYEFDTTPYYGRGRPISGTASDCRTVERSLVQIPLLSPCILEKTLTPLSVRGEVKDPIRGKRVAFVDYKITEKENPEKTPVLCVNMFV